MRFHFILLILVVSSCTNPVEENYRQLDVSLQTSLDHKEKQIDDLIDASTSTEIKAIREVHDNLEFEFALAKEKIFQDDNPRIKDLDDANRMNDTIQIPDSAIIQLRRSIVNFSDVLNSLARENVCHFEEMSVFHPDTFPRYFQNQQAPSALVFLRKLELDCLQCKYLAIKTLQQKEASGDNPGDSLKNNTEVSP